MSRNKLDLDMIIVLGLTGAGKSYFINRLTGVGEDGDEEGNKDSVKEGNKLASCRFSKLRSLTRQLIWL